MINGQMRQAMRERLKADAIEKIHGHRTIVPLTRQVKRRNDILEAKALKKRMREDEAKTELKARRAARAPKPEKTRQQADYRDARRREASRTRGVMAREKHMQEAEA